jgi:hypothetical protein
VSDIGLTFTVTSGSPQFAALASYLTNGTNDNLVLFDLMPDGTGGGYVFSEASLLNFFGAGPDFAGSEIQSISLTLNNLVLQYPVSIPDSPELGGNWNYEQYDVTLFFSGTPVPEPTTILLLGLGALITKSFKLKAKSHNQ